MIQPLEPLTLFIGVTMVRGQLLQLLSSTMSHLSPAVKCQSNRPLQLPGGYFTRLPRDIGYLHSVILLYELIGSQSILSC